MNMLLGPAARLRRFLKDEEHGAVSVEAVMVMPLLLWWYVASFVFFDGFKQYNLNVKATYTVGDLLSRQTDAVDDEYLEAMNDVFDYLTNERFPSWLRLTQVYWQESQNRYVAEWSYGTNGHQSSVRTTDGLRDIEDQLPELYNGERVLVIESFTSYSPAFNVGLDATFPLSNFVVTRPRFAPQVARAD